MIVLVLLYFTIQLALSSGRDSRCGLHEVFSECAQPEDCMTCTNPQKCSNFTCKGGCDCIQGYYRHPRGWCVPRHKCPVPEGLCGENEAYYDAVPDCKRNTCKYLGNPAIPCELGPPGCFCKEGYLKNKDGKCVPYVYCDLVCPSNEIFSDCAQPRDCKTCTNPEKCLNFTCNEGCECIYYRNADEKCVERQHCPVPDGLCGENEAYYDAVPSCKNTCEHFGNPGIFCAFGPEGCFCKEGFVKRRDGRCVRYEDCKTE